MLAITNDRLRCNTLMHSPWVYKPGVMPRCFQSLSYFQFNELTFIQFPVLD